MRILPLARQKAVLAEVCGFAMRSTKFQLPDCDLHVKVIPGETEGLYGWIAANYLLGGFDKSKDHEHGKGHYTYGFLDMGGASAQIAFAPNATEAEKHASDLTLLRLRSINGDSIEYKVFVTTWLRFGVNQARERYVEALINSSPGAMELRDPCLPLGLKVTKVGNPVEAGSPQENGREPLLLGTGKFSECLRQTYPLLGKDKDCPDQPCLLNGQHVPAIDFDVNHFVGVSEYWHTTHGIFKEKGHKDKAYDFETYQQQVQTFCSQSWKDIQKGILREKWGHKVDETTALEVCFKASWLINVLHGGIGIPKVATEPSKDNKNTTKEMTDKAKAKGFLDPFRAVDKIEGVELSWTLGKMVLYASSEIAASSSDALAVGFGSNVPGIPDDFQHPGGSYISNSSSGGDDDWRDTLFSENSRRIPGFLIFVAIVFVICFMLCGRERRKTTRQKLFGLFGRRGNKGYGSLRRRRGFADKLFGIRTGPIYERVLEDGEADDFELDSLEGSDHDHSDSSDENRIGRTSGWMTPQLKSSHVDSGPPSYFDQGRDVMAQGASLGLGPPAGGSLNAIDRGGLMSRTDSRERLVQGKKSRASSPSRLRSPMMILKE